MRDQQRHVFATLVERRHLDVHDVEAVVQILAEVTAHDQLLQVAVRGGDDAHVDRRRLGAADRAHLVLLQHAQQLDLQTHRHVADLVEHQRAAVGRLEQAAVLANRAGERALHVTEQLALEQVLGHRAAVDRDERPIATRARLVNRACQQLFAGAAFARDHDARVGARDHVRLRETLFHDRAARDDLAAPVFGRVGEAGDLQRLLHLIEQFLLVDRLGEERERAALRRLHCIRNRAVRGQDDDAQPRRATLDFLEQADAVHLVHAQIGDDEIRTHARRAPRAPQRRFRLRRLRSSLRADES